MSLFDGSTSYMLNDEPPAGALAAPLTISAWFRPTSLGSAARAICISKTAVDDNHLFAITVGSTGQVSANTGDNAAVASSTSTGTMVVGRWHLVTAVFAAINSRTVYLDRTAATVNTTSRTPAGMGRIAIGARVGATVGVIFSGDIAHPTFWSAALGLDEIEAMVDGKPPGTVRPSALLESWRLVPGEGHRSERSYRLLTAFGTLKQGWAPPRVRVPERNAWLAGALSFGGGGFQPAWAARRPVVIGSGVY
jgi:hypothetical protein